MNWLIVKPSPVNTSCKPIHAQVLSIQLTLNAKHFWLYLLSGYRNAPYVMSYVPQAPAPRFMCSNTALAFCMDSELRIAFSYNQGYCPKMNPFHDISSFGDSVSLVRVKQRKLAMSCSY